MHIWYIHPYGGGPGIGYYDRPYQLARAWRAQGHSATIFISQHHHLLEKGVELQARTEVDGIRYVAVPARKYSGNGVGRLLNLYDFAGNLRSVDRAGDLPRPDAVIASSPHPFAIFAAHRLARRAGAKLVFEIRDIWPLSVTELLGASSLHPFVMLCAVAERFALSRSDLVSSVLPRADRYLLDRGYGHKPFAWVPNGIDTATPALAPAFASEEARIANAKLDAWRAENRVRIIYTGSIGKPNAIDLLVQAMVHARGRGEDDRCGVLIVGKGDQLEGLRALAQGAGLSNIHFSGQLPKSDAVGLLANADIGYAGLRNVENLFGYGISPNKIADYFKAALPTFLPLAPCGDPVSESGGGIARKAEDGAAVWEGLGELIAMPQAGRSALGERGRDYIVREYDYDIIARRYVAAIEAL